MSKNESNNNFRGIIVSDFNTENFANLLRNGREYPNIEIISNNYDQVMQSLLKNSDSWKVKPDFAVVWTLPNNIINSFQKLISYESVSIESILEEVDTFSAQIANCCEMVETIFVPTWVLPYYNKNFCLLEMKYGSGISNILMQMNIRLSKNINTISNIFVLNTQNWLMAGGSEACNPRLWYSGKIPFGNAVFKEAAKDIKAGLRAISGQYAKLILLDLDETLWGGIVGDIGWENIKLGGHDPIGEAFLDFQYALKYLKNQGVILGIVSKNEETVALEAINNHPDMVLTINDFSGWRINWQDKASNIVDLVSELNLGLDSAVFIDDNPVERDRVKQTLPEIFVPDWPENKLLYKKNLNELRCFNKPPLSDEDRFRTEMYIDEKKRNQLKKQMETLDDWLERLDINIVVEKLKPENHQRTIQLFNKTNQMNLSTRRMGLNELLKWTNSENHQLWTIRVSDIFGDSGLTGILSLDLSQETAKLIDFILSCRVMGRKVEETMLYIAIKFAKLAGKKDIKADYLSTPKNIPCKNFFLKSGFSHKNNTFFWHLSKEFIIPQYLKIEFI